MEVQVRSGDTLWSYSNTFNVPLPLIIHSNPTINPSSLSIGQTIQIPGYQLQSYNIKAGDSLYKLASTQRSSIDSLLLVNPNTNPRALQIGQSIQIPSRVTSTIINPRQNYDSQVLAADLENLADLYPFMRMRTIGKSVMGKDLIEIQIGRGEKVVHWNGAFHAQEWITSAVIMEFVNNYLLALTNNEAIRGHMMYPFYDQITLSIVPMVDPDGVDLGLHGPPEGEFGEEALRINGGNRDFRGWKANIRGVDLNNQYPANWEIEAERKPKQPAPRDFPGYAPLTEPESIAMAELAAQLNFEKLLAFHTQGEVIYWGYKNLEPAGSRRIINEFSRVSGYDPIRYVYSFAGYKDWFIQDFRKPGFTVELGQGINPLPITQFDEIYQKTLGIFLASMYM
ncbi:M14 family metallopeptidase [Halobacillus sp. A5]|uniref:M14 family metallopeptidase n=1 Tax=Halobacillus sp. A5 TaxID=2880263 RepID=UPI0020A64862|nr:M14 family metallopeptidase [Halobacillus sp. A5]MCP3028872.1 M14 family metallopeptidase [Halobacillus sp. A5]